MNTILSRDLPMHKHSPSSLNPLMNEIIAWGEMLKDVHLFGIIHANNEMFGIFRQVLVVVLKRENGYNVGDTGDFQIISLPEGTYSGFGLSN